MADVKCPMCSKANRADAEVCEFCGARITPVTAPLDAIKPGQMPTNKHTSELERTLPGWLRDIRKASGQDDKPVAPDAPTLAGATARSSEPAPLQSPPAPEPARPPEPQQSPLDFLASLGASDDEEEEVPDWLKGLRADEPAAPAHSAPAPAAESGLKDLISSLDAPHHEEISQPEPEPWSFEGAKSVFNDDGPEPSFSFEQETPDWLAALKNQQEPGPTVPPAGQPSASESSAFDGDLPSWLGGLAEPGSAAPASQPAASDDTPDWLSSLAAETPAPASQPAAADDTPDWLSSLAAETPAPASQPAASDDTPDWLSALSTDQPSEQPPARSPKAFQTGTLGEIGLESTPDWMAGLGVLGSSATAASTPSAFEKQAAGGSESEPPKPESEDSVLGQFDFAAEESLPIPSASAENLDAILPMDVPDWLAGFTPGEAESGTRVQTPQPEEAENLAPANLPSWVQALRPVESVVTDTSLGEEERIVEQQGPLAGFRAVLPAQAALLTGRKPKPHAIKLQADEVQIAQASLLDELVQSEGRARAVAARRTVVASPVLRWVIAAVLFALTLLPALAGSQFVPIPTRPTSDLADFILTVYELQSDAPVLVAMDYQPALAGEMEAALTPVLNDLMINGKPLAFISTQPSGPLMVSRMMARMAQEPYRHTYQAGQQYVDLGYLPGEAAGIQSFASQPRRAIGANGFNPNFWESPALSTISRLDEFSAVIVVTDNPDIGRIWVEQAGGWLSDTPLLMVISAQAEPMIRPYYDSGQVSGLVTGLAGGAIYENNRQGAGLARAYWDSYGFGLVAAQLLILVGGIWSLVAGLVSRRKTTEEA